MKRFFLVVLSVLCLTAFESFAQNFKFMSTDFAYKVLQDNGYWSDWSEWEESRCLININLDREEINIYSQEPQEFTIYDMMDPETDSEGGKQYKMKCVDGDGLRCSVRLRIQTDGQRQLYVDYSDIMYVYCMVEK